jgi:hypothetical protein
MVKRIIDAIIDNYEQKLIALRENADHLSNALKVMTKKYERADDAKSDLFKANATLQRELSTAQLDKLRTMDHLIAVVGFVSRDTAVHRGSICRAALRDALYAIPANAVTTDEQAHIDALVKALDTVEAQE